MAKGDIDERPPAEDGNTEEWHQNKYDKNASDSCKPIGDSVFRFIKKCAGGSFFVGHIVDIQSNNKRKCKLRGNCFVVTILSRNIPIPWVGRNKK